MFDMVRQGGMTTAEADTYDKRDDLYAAAVEAEKAAREAAREEEEMKKTENAAKTWPDVRARLIALLADPSLRLHLMQGDTDTI